MSKKPRKNQVQKAIKDNPTLKNNEDVLNEISEDADRYHALKSVLDQAGGELLVEALIADVVRNAEIISASYRTLTLQEFIAHAAQMQVALNLARSLTRAGENLKGADEALKEALRE